MSEATTNNELIAPGPVHRYAFNGEAFVFTEKAMALRRDAVAIEAGGYGGGDALSHVHPDADEDFMAEAGPLKLLVDRFGHVPKAVGQ